MLKNMKSKLLILALITICLSICLGSSLAYFTASEVTRNVITMGNIKIELIETDKEGKPFQNLSSIMPGNKVDKIVTVKNTSTNACWVRIEVEKEITLTNQETGDPSLLKIDINDTDWLYQDNYYYYKNKLEPGEQTTPLFTTVSFDQTMDDKYSGCKVNITVAAQAVQSANNSNSVLEAQGWPD